MDALEKMKILLDEQTATILKLTAQKPLTASQIGRELHLPHSVCYRKIKTLIDAELISETGQSNEKSGHVPAKQYKSNIDRAYVSLEQGEFRCVLKLKDNSQLQTIRIVS